MTLHCGYESWKLSQLANGELFKLENLDTRHEPGWFASDVLLTLGLIGTVAGFIPMLAGAFTGINIANVSCTNSIGKYGSWNVYSIIYNIDRFDYKYNSKVQSILD